jgi:hypothetical protein
MDTWCLALREEHKLRVFEETVLRRIFRPKGDKVNGGWRKLHTEELHNLYQIKEDEMGRACSMNGGEEECTYDIGGRVRRKETTRKTKT